MRHITYHVLLTGLILILAFQRLSAQQLRSSDSTTLEVNLDLKKRHSINIEALGRTFLFGSVNYEFLLTRRWSVGGGAGLVFVNRGEILRNNNGVDETGRYLEIASTQMLYVNHLIGKKRHKLVLTTGMTNFLNTSRNTYPTETELFRDFNLEWNVGIGYQYSTKRMYFRYTGYFVGLPYPNSWFPKYWPWLGLSVGYKIL